MYVEFIAALVGDPSSSKSDPLLVGDIEWEGVPLEEMDRLTNLEITSPKRRDIDGDEGSLTGEVTEAISDRRFSVSLLVRICLSANSNDSSFIVSLISR